MTAGGNLICNKCGYSNVPGDQFCGSCGSFLEWEGVPAEPAPPPTGTGDIPTVPSRPDPPGGPPPTTAAPPMPGPVDAGLVRCPACGIANPAGRTFCLSCGTKLPDSARVTAASTDQIAAAVAAPNRPTGVGVRTATTDPEEGSSGGIVKWLIALALLGVLVGVGFVVVTNLLRSDGVTGASANPSIAVVPSGGSAGIPSGAPTDEPTDSAPPAVSVPLVLTGATASSTVGPDLPAFLPEKVIDKDPATSWQEGARNEKGQWVEVAFAPATVTSVVLSNGYNKSGPLYRGNHRLKQVLVHVGDAEPVAFTLKDTGQPQRVPVEPVDGATRVRVEIVSIYPAVKTKVANTPFDDAALDEILVMGVTTP